MLAVNGLTPLAVVILVLFVMLGNFRAALITAAVIPINAKPAGLDWMVQRL